MRKNLVGLPLFCFYVVCLCVVGALGAHAATSAAGVVACGVGDVAWECGDIGSWTISANVETVGRRDVVTIRLASPTEAVPPRFRVSFEASGADVLHVWTPFNERCQLWPVEWGGSWSDSELAFRAPVGAAFNERDGNKVTIACSEAFRRVRYRLAVDSVKCRLNGNFEFFSVPEAPMREYEAKILVDRRDVFWGDAVRDASEWISSTAGLAPAEVPEMAFEPLYSSWYAFWQDVHAPVIEQEASLAAQLGMKVAILDDGWQKEKSRTYYSATGDWRPVPSRFPDMKAHVAAVHDAGLKYMLWLSVPFIGDESGAWAVFKDKCLFTTDDGVGRLDPRFPEVRKYLVGTYERVVGEWGFDGVKLDFIDEFSLRGRKDPAVAQGYAGRDIRSLPEAVDRLMKEVVSRLRAIRPDVLIEFRQQYMGPAVRQYGNMIRATDCPADLAANRRRVADLRLTSGKTAVHSDMLVWSADETPENAARAVLSAIFGVVQYSMVLQSVPESHREMMRHWIAFSTKHRNALLKGGFRPHHPEMQYPWIESWDGSEHIVAAYAENLVLPVVAAGKDVYVLNASQEPSLVLDVKGRAEAAEVFDTFGQSKGVRTLAAGLNRIAVPVGGYAKVEATDVSWPMERLKSPPRVHDASTYRTNGVEVAFLEGLQYKGRPTRIFCYWGVPEHKKGEKVPGVVLVHGGAGSAFYRWVKYWNSRGYAAVSMDTCGSVSGNVVGSEQRRHFRHEWGGPSGWGGFDTLDAPVEDQWMYHAVADAVICNSFLRSLDGVDPGRIGITGVSWGGVITCIAASVDDRFAFAAPVYGCGGFLRNSPMWTGEVAKMGDKAYEWESLWDPLRYLRGLKTPVLWLTGTNDRAFSLPSLMESHASVGCEKHLSVKVRLVHTHGPVSENSPEVEAFADSFCKGSRPLAELGDVSFDVTSRRASCEVSGGAGAVKAWLVYTADVGAWEKRKWHAVDARVESDGRCVSAEVPAGVAVFYFNVVDDRGLVAATRAVSASVVVEGADSPVRRNCVVRLAAD